MEALPICDELRGSINSPDWEPMFILRCQREISEDLRPAREINALCARLIAIVNERENFADELDILVGRSVPDKMDVIDYKLPCSFSCGRGKMDLEDMLFTDGVDYLMG
ncbi:hypothetical protein Tco_0668204 [Tanacetum coccineum]